MKINLLIATLLSAGALSLPIHAQDAAPAPGGAATPAAMEGKTATPDMASSPAASPAAAKMHFGGSLTAVDASGKTVTVHTKKNGDLNFTVSDTTKVTKTDGTPATLADFKVGDHAHGAFTKNGDGTMTLLTLKVGPAVKKSAQ